MEDITSILLYFLAFLFVIVFIVYLIYLLKPTNKYRFYKPPLHYRHEHFSNNEEKSNDDKHDHRMLESHNQRVQNKNPNHHFKHPDCYIPYQKSKCYQANKHKDFGGCHMGNQPFMFNYDNPKCANIPTYPKDCLDFFPEKERKLIETKCETTNLKLLPEPSNSSAQDRGWCCPTSLKDLHLRKYAGVSLGSCGYDSVPANLTWDSDSICQSQPGGSMLMCHPDWEQAFNPNESPQYSNSNHQPCCVLKEGKELEHMNWPQICADLTERT